MYTIPQSVLIEGKEYPIRNKGDFRVILDCFEVLNDVELTAQERLLASLIIFLEDMNSVYDLAVFENIDNAISAMFNFFRCGETESPGAKMNFKLIDWQKDSQLICSAINKVAGKEIRAESYLHWWTFMGYFLAIGESPLATIVSIRNKIMRGTKLDKSEMKFRRENPEYFIWDSKTAEQKEDDELIRQLWNQGK